MSAGTGSSPWLVPWQSASACAMRLFCFPHAGAGASGFSKWSGKLPEDMELWAVRLPGRESRFNEPAAVDVEELLGPLEKALAPYDDLPFAFYGHCSGSVLSFELARRLRRHGAPQPVHLFVMARDAPQLPPRRTGVWELPTEAFIAEVNAIGEMDQGILSDPQLLELVEPILRADFRLFESYRYAEEPPLDLPISVFGGASDPVLRLEDLAAWHAQTRARFTLRLLAGGHLSMSAPDAVTQAISHDLAATREDTA